MMDERYVKCHIHEWVLEAGTDQAKARGIKHPNRVVAGLTNGLAKQYVNEKQDFVYLDHSYFKRGWSKGHFRALRSEFHQTKTVKRSDDRLKRFGVEIEPWRKTGRRIVVIPPSPFYVAIWPELQSWTGQIQHRIAQHTDRPIVVKDEKGGLREFLSDAWALVSCLSVAGMEAALMGVPVFSTPRCCSWPISDPIEKIETPTYPDRHEWACSLAYASWHVDEIDTINWLDYAYALCDDMPPGRVRRLREDLRTGLASFS